MIKFKHQTVPKFITEGFHSQYAFPYATKLCNGIGLDIGCSQREWALPGSVPIDIKLDDEYDAYNLPEVDSGFDYIFSSHCLEHLPDYQATLAGWVSKIKKGGTIFLYLPHPDCLYWQPNEMPTKLHLHTLTPMIMTELFKELGVQNVFCSERDLAYSFAIYGTI
jgi:hypothetical protein